MPDSEGPCAQCHVRNVMGRPLVPCAWASERFFSGSTKKIFTWGLKATEFHFTNSKLREQPLFRKMSTFKIQGAKNFLSTVLPTPMTMWILFRLRTDKMTENTHTELRGNHVKFKRHLELYELQRWQSHWWHGRSWFLKDVAFNAEPSPESLQYGSFTFVRGLYVRAGGAWHSNLTKIPVIYSVYYFNLGGWSFVWGG